MSIKMTRNNRGFTIVEIIVVLVLISIIAAATFTRSITTDQINFVGQVDKILSHIRYTKSLAMKRGQGDNTERWGIFCTANDYWLFHWIDDGTAGDEAIAIKFPGEENGIITLADLGVDMDFFLLYFDNLGKPYTTNAFNNLTSDLSITISSAADATVSREIIITPETGFIKTQ